MATMSAGVSANPYTMSAFCAVTAVATLAAYMPKAVAVLMSA